MAVLAWKTIIKSMLGIPAGITQFDQAIEYTLDAVDVIMQDEIGLPSLTNATYSEKIDIVNTGINEIALQYRPISSIVALTMSDTLQVLNTDYSINKSLGIIKLLPLSNSFITGRNVIDVTYVAGFGSSASDIPSDLTYAANLIGCALFNQQSHVGFSQEKSANYSYRLEQGIPTIAKRILNKHRRLFARGMNQD